MRAWFNIAYISLTLFCVMNLHVAVCTDSEEAEATVEDEPAVKEDFTVEEDNEEGLFG